jgi:hypothetical protein
MLAADRNRLGTKLHERRATTIARQHGNWYSPLTQKTHRRKRDSCRAAALLRIVVDYDNSIEHHTAVVLMLSEWLPLEATVSPASSGVRQRCCA